LWRRQAEAKPKAQLNGQSWAPDWWIANGGDQLVDGQTLARLQDYEASMGSTLTLHDEYVDEYTLEGLHSWVQFNQEHDLEIAQVST